MTRAGLLSSSSRARRSLILLGAAFAFGAAGCGSVVSVETGSGNGGSGGSGASTGWGGGAGSTSPGGGSSGASLGCSVKAWGRGFPDSYKYEYGESIAVDTACNVVVAGSFGGTMDFGGGSVTGQDEDLFVVKLDGAGNHLWSKAFGIEPFQGSARVAVDPEGNIVLAGTFSGTLDFGTGTLLGEKQGMYVAKLDPSGHALWARSFGGGSENIASAVAVAPDGSVALTGYFTGAVDFGTGSLGNDGAFHPFVARLDPDGHTKWATAFSGLGAHSTGIAIDWSGEVLIAGSFQSSLTVGPFKLTDIGGAAFVARLAGDGSVIYARSITGTGQRDGVAVAADGAGEALVLGAFDNTVDLPDGPHATQGDWDGFVVAFNPDGEMTWGKTFGGSGTDQPSAIVPDSEYGSVIAGSFTGDIGFDDAKLSSFGPEDGFVAILADGHWFSAARRFGGPSGGGDAGLSVAVAPDGAQLVTGIYQGATDFGSGPVESAGGLDAFVAKFPR